MKRLTLSWVLGAFCAFILTTGCQTAPKTAEEKADIKEDAAKAVARAEKVDPGFTPLINSAAGYASFPSVGKGGAGIGGAYGKGVLFEKGQPVGYCDIRQATIGAQIGGQDYTELVLFQTPEAVAKFKKGEYTFNAQVSAVALKSGASQNAKYSDGVAVFTLDESGLMAEAAVGGQRFTYQPITHQ